MAKVRGKEDLPEWFNLNEYQGCKSFIAIDWMTALDKRRLLLELIETEDIAGATKLAESIREDPTDCFRLDSDLPENPVKPLTFSKISSKAGISLLTGFAFPERAEKWGKTLEAIATGHWLSHTDTAEIDDPSDTSRCLVVNLDATDSVLKEAFAEWLESVRLQSKIDSKRELPAYQKWHRYGLLPYLDLLCWQKLTGNNIPYDLMSRAVGYAKGGDSFRKIVPPLCKKLPQLIAELEALAAIENDPERPEV